MIHCKCGRKFGSVKSQAQHEFDRNKIRQTRRFLCSVSCCRAFLSETKLLLHQESTGHWNSTEEMEAAKARRICPCGKIFKTASGCDSHRKSKQHSAAMSQDRREVCYPLARDTNLESDRHEPRIRPDKPYACQLCSRSFSSQKSLDQHQKSKHQRQDNPYSSKPSLYAHQRSKHLIKHKPYSCQFCRRSFSSQSSLYQHQRSQGHTGSPKEDSSKTSGKQSSKGKRQKQENVMKKQYTCIICSLGFADEFQLYSHQEKKGHWCSQDEKNIVVSKKLCDICAKELKTFSGIVCHRNSKKHLANLKKMHSNEELQNFMTDFYDEKVRVDSDDRKDSVATIRGVLTKVMEHVRSQPGGEIYSPSLRKAGSYAVKTKIGKADEFDWSVPLHVNPEDVMTETKGRVLYRFEDQDRQLLQNMNTDIRVVEDEISEIPDGYSLVRLKGNTSGGLPSNLLYGDCVVPRFVKKDLYNKIKIALEDTGLAEEGVCISREAHGPALTMTIMPPLADSHHISVDIVPSLTSTIPVTSYGWPRKASVKAFSEERIEAVVEAGTHLVPKKDVVFAISFSKAEKALLEGIDAGNECRKMCHQVIKKYVKNFGSQTPATGISSHIFKHQLLNMSEAHHEPGYWAVEQFGERVVDMLEDSEDCLRIGTLRNHFKPSENVLEGKDRKLLNGLADYFETKRLELENL